MERDQHLKKLFRESGIVHAPDGFTEGVMEKVQAGPERVRFRPLIGRTGRMIILLSVIVFLVIAIFYGGTDARPSALQLPDFDFTLQFLQEINLSTGLIAAIVAILVLVLSDAGLSRRRIA